jgi:hypothetical protein
MIVDKLRAFGLVGLLLITAGCAINVVQPGPTETLNETVELNGAERVNLRIRPALQELTLRGGAEDLLAGEFTYNLEQLEPVISYTVEDGVGELEIGPRNENVNTIPIGNVVSEWNLQLNEETPLAVDLGLGLGDSNLDFSDLTLTELDIEAGAGEVQANVGRQDLDRLHFQAGLGDVDLQLGGGRLDDLDFEAGAGDVTIDLTGDWESDLDGRIEGGLGEINLTLPAEVGVRVEVERGLGDVNAPDLREEEENVYVNAAYGKAPVTLDLMIEQAAGDVTLAVAELR